MENKPKPDYGPRDIEDDYFQEIYDADRIWRQAQTGDPKAMYEMGKCFYYGTGRSENCRLALQYLLKPAEEGNADAQFLVGRIYEDGELVNESEYQGVTKDLDKAAEWLAKAAEQGHERARQGLERLRALRANEN